MNKSFVFRKKALKRCEEKEMAFKQKVLNVLDLIDFRAQNNIEFRNEFYKWFLRLENYSTLELRKLFKIMGYDYWENIENSNLIDFLDSTQL